MNRLPSDLYRYRKRSKLSLDGRVGGVEFNKFRHAINVDAGIARLSNPVANQGYLEAQQQLHYDPRPGFMTDLALHIDQPEPFAPSQATPPTLRILLPRTIPNKPHRNPPVRVVHVNNQPTQHLRTRPENRRRMTRQIHMATQRMRDPPKPGIPRGVRGRSALSANRTIKLDELREKAGKSVFSMVWASLGLFPDAFRHGSNRPTAHPRRSSPSRRRQTLR